MANKTFKREYAFFFVVLIASQIYLENKDILEIIIWPFISFIAASAGLHIYDKNSSSPSSTNRVQYGREGSSEYPDK